MQIKILLFGIVSDLVEASALEMELNSGSTIADFKVQLNQEHPQLKNYATYAIALNEEYALDETLIQDQDVIAIIPPVSGG